MEEQEEIGGVPFLISVVARFFPKDKTRKEKYFRVVALLLTFITLCFSSAARKPLPAVQRKIIETCNITLYLLGSSPESFPKWCKGTIIERNTEYMMGNVLSLFLLIFGVSTYFSGVIADCFNPRYFLSAGCLLSGFYSIALGLCDEWQIYSYTYLNVTLTLLAVCQSTIWPVILTCTTNWYTGNHRGFFFGIWNINHYTGGLIGTFMTSLYIDNNWGWSFYIPGFALMGIGFLNLMLLIVHPSDLKVLEKKKPTQLPENEMDIPPWMDPQYGIKFIEALKIPGVIEYSACMFFSRITSYSLTYRIPGHIYRKEILKMHSKHTYYSISFAIGAVVGGLIVGVLKDVYNKSSVICIIFLILSIPAMLLQYLVTRTAHQSLDITFHIILGIFVEAPYILLSTSVSADLGTHSMIRRGLRGLSTVAGIIEGSGILGNSLAPILQSYIMKYERIHSFLLLSVFQVLSALCLIRLTIKEFKKQMFSAKSVESFSKSLSNLNLRL